MIAISIEIAVILFFAYIVVVIVKMMTKPLVAYVCVTICLLVYAGIILAFQPAQDQHDPQHHDHYKCKQDE